MSFFYIGAYYPADSQIKRINRYRENKRLFKGEHFDVFEKVQNRLSGKSRDLVYVSVNLPGIICKKSADFMFGETPGYSAGKEDDAPEQQALERMVSANNLNIKTYQSALGNAYRGDSFFKIRWGQKYGGVVDKKFDPFRVIIENQNAEYVFPETSPGDNTEILVYHIAYPVKVDGAENEYILNVESHYPGVIHYTKWRMNPLITTVEGDVEQWKIYAEIEGARREVPTGIPFPLVVHIPNYATDDDWEGLDDITEHKPIFDEINNRLTQIANILDKHSDPAIAVPAGTLGEDENGNPTFHVGRDKVFEIMGKDDVIPQYLTWNGQLQAAFEELKKLVEYLLICAEIPAVALGSGDSGTSGSSGLSIKFRMNSLLAKINRKRQFYDKGIKEVFIIAQLLEQTRSASKPGYEIFEPIIKFKDGLPDDEAEQANIMAIRTGGKATISVKTALMVMDNLTEQQAEQELERIEEEEKALQEMEATADPSIFNAEPDQEPEEKE